MSAKRIGVFGAVGVIAAVLVISGFVLSGLEMPGLSPNLPGSSSNLPELSSNMGTLIVKLTDAPVEIEELWVTITSLAIHKSGEGDQEGGWMTLPFVEDKTSVVVDILSLQGVTTDLSESALDPGDYSKLRMDVSKARAIYETAEEVDLMVPPGHIDINVHLQINAEATTTLLVDMTPHVSQTNRLSPVLKATVIS